MSIRQILVTLLASLSLFTTHISNAEVVGGGSGSGGSRLQFDSNYKSPPLPKDKKIPEECKKFIKDDGTYGEYGEILKKEFTGQGKSKNHIEDFFSTNPDDIEKTCSGYTSMNNDEKLNFWIWTSAAIAKDESACNWQGSLNSKAGPNGNGVAQGLCQTPKLEEGKTPAWRGPGCEQPPFSAENQLSCTVEVLGGLLEGKYKQPKTPFGSNSYWAVLRPNNTENQEKRDKKTDTLSIIKEFPRCKNK
ncbi:MAG: hypothetical protein H6623_07605 [Bdellovibrionaceae bacterium]|nr:hypothetical protein [Pseudobdellovibrionaceae bacterium]